MRPRRTTRRRWFDRASLPAGGRRPIFGPIVGLKVEWEEQGASAKELDFSAFRYRCEARGSIPVNTGRQGGYPGTINLALRDFVRRARARRILELAGAGGWEGSLAEMRGDAKPARRSKR